MYRRRIWGEFQKVLIALLIYPYYFAREYALHRRIAVGECRYTTPHRVRPLQPILVPQTPVSQNAAFSRLGKYLESGKIALYTFAGFVVKYNCIPKWWKYKSNPQPERRSRLCTDTNTHRRSIRDPKTKQQSNRSSQPKARS